MKKVFMALLIGLLLTACAGTRENRENMVEDLGSPAKVALLKQRAKAFWTAFVKEDYEKVYDFYEPFFRAKMNKYTFIGSRGAVKYSSFEVKDVKVEGNVAYVTMRVTYSVPGIKYKRLEFSKPETQTEFVNSWLFIDGNWYREYKSAEQPAFTEY
jgi:uncharacterized protein YchJ